MRLDEEQVQLMKRRGGVGHDLSQIRPKGTPVNNSALTSTGLVLFMERFQQFHEGGGTGRKTGRTDALGLHQAPPTRGLSSMPRWRRAR